MIRGNPLDLLGLRDRAEQRGGPVVPALAVIAMLSSVPTLFSWALGIPSLGQPLRVFPVSRPLGLVLIWIAALCLIAIWRARRRVAQQLSVVLTLASVIGAAVGVFFVDLPIGIAFAVAGMFSALGVAFWMLSRPTISHRALVVSSSVGAILLAMCGVLVMAALGDMLQTEVARRIAQVSLNTLVGIIALSAALLRYVAAHESTGVAPPRWLALTVGVTGALMTLVFWQSLLAREHAETRARAAIASDAVQRAIRRQFVVIDRTIARVAIYAQTAPANATIWHSSMSRLPREIDGLEDILWFDSLGALVHATGDSGLTPAVVADLGRWAIRGSDREPTAYAAPQMRVALPQVARTTANGVVIVVGLLSARTLITDFIAGHGSGFEIRAFVNDSQIAGSPSGDETSVFRSTMLLGDRQVDLTFSPNPVPVRSTFPELLLLMGLSVAALAAVTLWLARKSWEQASRQGMARMQRAIERSTDGVWELDLLQGTSHRSGALVRSLGYEPSQLNGAASAWTALIHAEDSAHVSAALSAHVAGTTEVFECEYRMRAADGGWHTIVDRGRVIERTIDGRPARLLGITADITERAHAEAEQEKSERRFRAMFDSAYRLQLLLDRDGTILEANRASADAAGLTVEAMQGLAFNVVRWWNNDEGMSARVQERFERARAGETTRFEVRAWMPEGRSTSMDFSLRPIRDASEQVIQVLVEGHDLTERKRAEESLRQIGALTTMGQLAARVAHEINNPLAGIQNAFLLVRDGIPTDHPHYRFVGAIEREIARIAAVTRQLYETYRPDQAMDSQSSVILALSDAVSFLEQVNRTRNVKIVTSVARAPSLVPVPDALLRQTLYNLVQNAFDASPPNGTIEVSAVHEGEWCVIRVCDEGPGIPERIRERIFEPFFSTKDRTMKTGGMGIGLALVRQSVLAVGGQVIVRDRASGGTEFEVRLPMQPIDTGVLQ